VGEHEGDEEQLAALRQQFPGWQIWASGTAWCARPWPLINADSAEDLAQRIRTAHTQPPDGSPSLASIRSYTARSRQLREFEEAAADAWMRIRAEADARTVAAQADPVERFHRRHGGQAVEEAQAPGPCVAAEDDGNGAEPA